MEQVFAVVGLVFVAMITPGPNNFVVMSQAACMGFGAAAKSATGVLIGTQVLLTLSWFGAAIAFHSFPYLQPMLIICGAVFLACLGGQMIWLSWAPASQASEKLDRGLPSGLLGLAAFQFFNPKSWVLVLAAIAAASGIDGELTGLALLSIIFLVISSLCLLLWAIAGAGISRWLKTTYARRWFDGVLGLVLVVCGAILLFS